MACTLRQPSGKHSAISACIGFKDWTCWAGVDYLYVTQAYDVISSWCRIREQGNLLEKRLHYDNQPVLCDGRLCACNTDVMTRKEFYDV